jgi:hypothetical protein
MSTTIHAIFNAASSGNLRRVQGLVSVEPSCVSQCDHLGSAVHRAITLHHFDIARYLIEHNANVNDTDRSGHTALHRAALVGSLELTQMLLDRKANVNATTIHQQTPLHASTLLGHQAIARLLIEYRACVNAIATGPEHHFTGTPLHLVAHNEAFAMLLVESGADLDIVNVRFDPLDMIDIGVGIGIDIGIGIGIGIDEIESRKASIQAACSCGSSCQPTILEHSNASVLAASHCHIDHEHSVDTQRRAPATIDVANATA